MLILEWMGGLSRFRPRVMYACDQAYMHAVRLTGSAVVFFFFFLSKKQILVGLNRGRAERLS